MDRYYINTWWYTYYIFILCTTYTLYLLLILICWDCKRFTNEDAAEPSVFPAITIIIWFVMSKFLWYVVKKSSLATLVQCFGLVRSVDSCIYIYTCHLYIYIYIYILYHYIDILLHYHYHYTHYIIVSYRLLVTVGYPTISCKMTGSLSMGVCRFQRQYQDCETSFSYCSSNSCPILSHDHDLNVMIVSTYWIYST